MGNTNNMLFMSKKFIECKNDFQQDRICSEVCFGFHYTQERNIQTIKRDGLITRIERTKDPSRLVFGDGIYVSNNYHGPIGLFVAILVKGRCVSSYFRRLHDGCLT